MVREVLLHLKWRFGECHFQIFDNGEIGAKILHSVANHDVFVVIQRASESNADVPLEPF